MASTAKVPEDVSRCSLRERSDNTAFTLPSTTSGSIAAVPAPRRSNADAGPPGPISLDDRSGEPDVKIASPPEAITPPRRESEGRSPDAAVRQPRERRLVHRLGVSPGHASNRTLVRDDMHHCPVGEERHRQSPHHVDEIFERDERRQTIGKRRQKHQGVALLGRRALTRSFRRLAFSDLDPQTPVGELERGGALLDARLELGMGGAQRPFAFAERAFCIDAFGDVNRVSEDVRGCVRAVGQHVAIHPYPGGPSPRQHSHQAGIVPMLLDPSQVILEKLPRVGREKLAQVATDAVLGSITKGAGRGGIDRKDVAIQVVGADQAKAIFDQFPVSPLAVVKRLIGFLPRLGRSFKNGRVRLAERRRHPIGSFAAIVLGHDWELDYRP